MKNGKLFLIHNNRPIFNELLLQWKIEQPEREIVPVDLDEVASLLTDFEPGAGVFIALDSWHLNFKRLEVFHQFALKGIMAEALVCRSASVPAGFKAQPNTYIGPGAIVELGCKIGHNSYIGAYAQIGAGSVVKNSVWIGRKADVGANVSIGSYVVIGEKVAIRSGLKVGSYVTLERPVVDRDVDDKTFVLERFEKPLWIFSDR